MPANYDVICPAAPWENQSASQDDAYDLCFDLAEEYGHALIRCNGVIVAEYEAA